jgi:chromosome segregation ATPase
MPRADFREIPSKSKGTKVAQSRRQEYRRRSRGAADEDDARLVVLCGHARDDTGLEGLMSEERLAKIEHELHGGKTELTGVNARLDEHDQQFQGINARLDDHDRRFDAVDRRFDGVDRRFDSVDRRFDEVIAGQAQLRVELEAQIASTRSEVLAQFEELKDNFKVIAEAQHSLARTVEKGFADIPRLIGVELSLINGAVRGHTTQLLDHETRIEKLEAR